MSYALVCIEGDRPEALLLNDEGALVMSFICGDDESAAQFGKRIVAWCNKELGAGVVQHQYLIGG